MRLALALAALVVAAGPAVAQSPAVYIFDVLRRPEYPQAYDRMFRGERNVAAWFGSAKRAAAGTTDAGKAVSIGGVQEELYVFCEPHNCNGNSFAVLFSRYGQRAVGASLVGDAYRYFGNPTSDEALELATAARQ